MTAVPGTPAGARSWLRNRATGQCLTAPVAAARAAGDQRYEKWVFGRGSGVPSRVMSAFSL